MRNLIKLYYLMPTNDFDKCVYSKSVGNDHVNMCLYVIDILIFGTSMNVITLIFGTSMNVINETKLLFSCNFNMKDLEAADVILGLKI